MARPQPRTNARGKLRRDAILRAAEEVFVSQGYKAGSLQSIAERVGLTQPGLLHHFPTKEHLFIEILEARDAQDQELMEHFVAEARGDLFEGLIAICQHNVETPGLTRTFTILAAESVSRDHPGHAWFVGRFRRTRGSLAAQFGQAQRAGWMSPYVDVELLATQILAMWDGLALQWELDPDEVDLVGGLTRYLDALRSQIGAPAAPQRSDSSS